MSLVADTLAGDQLLSLGMTYHNLTLLKNEAEELEPENIVLKHELGMALFHVEHQQRWTLKVASKEIGFTSNQLLTHYIEDNGFDENPGFIHSFAA